MVWRKVLWHVVVRSFPSVSGLYSIGRTCFSFFFWGRAVELSSDAGGIFFFLGWRVDCWMGEKEDLGQEKLLLSCPNMLVSQKKPSISFFQFSEGGLAPDGGQRRPMRPHTLTGTYFFLIFQISQIISLFYFFSGRVHFESHHQSTPGDFGGHGRS